MTTKEIIHSILEHEDISASSFAKNIGIHPTQIYDLQSGKTKKISASVGNKIISLYPNYNLSWLLTGEGDMLLSSPGKDKAVINYEDGVPYYDEDFVLGFNELGFPSSENPQFLVQMPKYANATLWCNATGHSMEPEINSGDVIALKLIEDFSFLLTGDLYAIITTNGLRTIKRLGKGRDEDHYRLIPTNKDYEEQEIPKRMILKVYKVLGNLHSF